MPAPFFTAARIMTRRSRRRSGAMEKALDICGATLSHSTSMIMVRRAYRAVMIEGSTPSNGSPEHDSATHDDHGHRPDDSIDDHRAFLRRSNSSYFLPGRIADGALRARLRILREQQISRATTTSRSLDGLLRISISAAGATHSHILLEHDVDTAFRSA